MANENLSVGLSDLLGASAVAPQSSQEKPIDTSVSRSASSLFEPEQKGYFSDKPVQTGVVKALSHAPGFLGDIAEISDLAGDYGTTLVNKAKGYISGKPSGPSNIADLQRQREEDYAWIAAHRNDPKETWNATLENAKSDPNLMRRLNLMGSGKASDVLPSGQTFQKMIFGSGVDIPKTDYRVKGANLGEYKPTTAAGRVAMAGIEGLTPGFGGKRAVIEEAAGIVPKALETTKNYLTRSAAPQAAAGAAGQGAYETTGSPLASIAAGIAAHKIGATAPRVLEANFSPERMSSLISGGTLRSSATDLNQVKSVLNAQQPELFTGMQPTTSRMTGDTGLEALEQRLASDRQPSDESFNANKINENNEKVYNQSASQLVESLNPKIESHLANELPSVDPKTGASATAHKIYSDLEQNAWRSQNQAWDDLFKTNIGMFTKKTLSPLIKYIDNLPIADRPVISATDKQIIEDIKNLGPQAPLKEIQSLRSRLLSIARDSTDGQTKRIYGGMAKELENSLSDSNNIVFGNLSNAQNRWRTAVDQTRNYHDIFTPDILEKVKYGKISEEALMQTLLGSKDKVQNINLLRKATGNAVDSSIAQWMLAKLTNNGTKTPTAEQVINEIKGDNASIYASVPEARLKMENLYKVAKQNDAYSALKKAISGTGKTLSVDPDAVLKALQEHRITLSQVAKQNPVLAKELKKFAYSSGFMQELKPSTSFKSPELQAIEKGKVHSLLYGKELPYMSTAAGAAGLAGAHHYLGLDPLNTLITGSMLGGGVDLLRPNSIAERLFSGNIADKSKQILNEARTNPDLAKKLIGAPELEKTPALRGGTGVMGVGVPAVNVSRQEEEKANQRSRIEREEDLFRNAPSLQSEDLLGQQSSPASDLVQKTDSGYRVTDRLLDNLSQVESSGNPNAINKESGAQGQFQFMPDTVKMLQGMGIKFDPFNPTEAREAARKYLEVLLERNGGDLEKALADYGGFISKDPAEYVSKVISGSNRVQRASGGKVGKSIGHLADRLMKMAKDAKKVSDKRTEPLLNAPDEAIVKALDVAQQAI